MTKTNATGRKSSRKITLTPKMALIQSERDLKTALQEGRKTINKEADELAELFGSSMKITGMSPKPIQPEIRELSELFGKAKIGGKKNRKTKKRANKKKSRATRRYW
jgi:hypothetical protein